MTHRIIIQAVDGDRIVSAVIRGEWAAHRDPGGMRGLTLTHVPTGRYVLQNLTPWQAARILSQVHKIPPATRRDLRAGIADKNVSAEFARAVKSVVRSVVKRRGA